MARPRPLTSRSLKTSRIPAGSRLSIPYCLFPIPCLSGNTCLTVPCDPCRMKYLPTPRGGGVSPALPSASYRVTIGRLSPAFAISPVEALKHLLCFLLSSFEALSNYFISHTCTKPEGVSIGRFSTLHRRRATLPTLYIGSLRRQPTRRLSGFAVSRTANDLNRRNPIVRRRQRRERHVRFSLIPVRDRIVIV